MNSTSRAGLDHFPRNLMTKDHSDRCRRAASDHMLITPADIRGNDLQNDAVLALPAVRANQFWKVDTFGPRPFQCPDMLLRDCLPWFVLLSYIFGFLCFR